MPIAMVVDLARNALMLAFTLAGPLLLISVGVGLVISIIQAVTQIQEQTLTFVPKLFAVAVAVLILMSWMLQNAVRYTTELLRSIPGVVS